MNENDILGGNKDLDEETKEMILLYISNWYINDTVTSFVLVKQIVTMFNSQDLVYCQMACDEPELSFVCFL